MPRLTTPFGFQSTAADVARGLLLTRRRVIITGGAAGIGLETARALADAGAEITLAVRRPEAARQVAAELSRVTGNRAIEVRQLDLSDLGSVRSFAEDWAGPLHVLINNATKRSKSQGVQPTSPAAMPPTLSILATPSGSGRCLGGSSRTQPSD